MNAIFALFLRRLGVNDNIQGLCLCHKYLIAFSAPQSITNTSDTHCLLSIFKEKTMPRTADPSAAETCETLCFMGLFPPTVLNNPLVPYVSEFLFPYTFQICVHEANATSADKGAAAARY